METAKTLYDYYDHYFDYRMAQMRKSLKELEFIIDRQQNQRPPIETRVIYRPVFMSWGKSEKKRTCVLYFPFTLLFNRVERAVERFVKTVVAGWIVRLTHILRPKQQ